MTPTTIGPRIAVMPAPGKPFDQFSTEEHECRQYAEWSIGISGNAGTTKQAIYDSREAQWRYDNAYKQCMYAKGNQVPGYQSPMQMPPPPPPGGARQSAPTPPPPTSR
ncbi:MAG: hypothetical protein V4443_07915 [Pseudomonadota bacterium]